MADDFRDAWEEAVKMYREQRAENEQIKTTLQYEISKLVDANRRLQAEVQNWIALVANRDTQGSQNDPV